MGLKQLGRTFKVPSSQNGRPQTFRNCLECGRRFGPLNHLNLRFCTRGCAYKWRTGRPNNKRGKHYPHLQRAEVRHCRVCHKAFRAIKDINGRFGSTKIRKQMICSLGCWSVRSGRNKMKCKYCGKVGLTMASNKYCSRDCAYRDCREEKAGAWKGENAGYSALHKFVASRRGQPLICEQCDKETNGRHEIAWANISGEYKRDLSDWARLCAKCHKAFDSHKVSLRQQLFINGVGRKAVKL